MPVILQAFSEENPFNVDDLNTMLEALAGAINGLAGQQLMLFTPFGGDNNTSYVPLNGGDMTGALKAPAIQVGTTGAFYPVLTTNSSASLATKGPVLKAAAVATLTQSISGSYVKSEIEAIQTRLNDLITALKNAGAVA